MGRKWNIWSINWSYCNRQYWCWLSIFSSNSWTRKTLLTNYTDNRVSVAYIIVNIELQLNQFEVIITFFLRSRFYFLTTTEFDLYGKNFFMPFVRTVWICLCIVIALVSFALWLIQWRDISKERDSIVLTSFGIFCQQGP